MNRLFDLMQFADLFPPPPVGCLLRRNRHGQTRVESAVALGVLIVAGVGAWMLYKDSIIVTTKAMIEFFGSGEGKGNG